jgi:indolepyruvate ferredoxin oxidoreductase
MAELGLSQAACEAAGVRLLKIGMVWPLEPEIIKTFAQGLQAILVVEEKRALIEDQIKAILYDAGISPAPKIIGKSALPGMGELSPNIAAHAIAKVFGKPEMAAHIPLPTALKFGPDGRPILGPMRMPSFCSGCPHSTSTKLPEGSRALAGIGCHGMALLTSPHNTMTISHMGGEGVMWVGQAPFTKEAHVFANMGDGTYFHSGFMAIRQAVAAKANMTYKLLVNGFVSMTGGQPIDGELSVPQIIRSLQAEGVSEVVIVTDDVERVKLQDIPAGIAVLPREQLDAVQRRLRTQGGTSVLIYDQPCATERRRLRKRGKWADPNVRTYIAPEVCEGCGDCGDASGCLSIEPLETPLGRKRKINQSSCNKDLSCVNGFCPSFVTIEGATPRRSKGKAQQTPAALINETLPQPERAPLDRPVGILFTGIGGTGVVTVGAIVSMAAHLDGLAVSTLDVTGLAQKYGAVMTHMRIATDAAQLYSARLAMGEADVVVGCDLLATAGDEALSRLRPDTARLVINAEEVPTFEFSKNPDWNLNVAELKARLDAKAPGRVEMVDASELARQLLGDAVLANMMLLGFAWQKGWVPVGWAALVRAVELNGVARESNLAALQWGRLLVIDPQRVQANRVTTQAKASAQSVELVAGPVAELLADRRQRLVNYQNAALADAYAQRLQPLASAPDAVQREAATQYFRLVADKDEFEVARLYTDPAFLAGVNQAFEGELKISFHLGGGPFSKTDPTTGKPLKTKVGPWMQTAFKLLAGLRGLRGGLLDPFRHSPERVLASKLRALYEQDLERARALVGEGRADAAAQLLAWPRSVRGYGHVRERNAAAALKQRDTLLAALSAPPAVAPATAPLTA